MYAIKRIIAYGIDLAIITFISGMANSHLYRLLTIAPQLEQYKGMLLSYSSLAISAGVPIVLFGTLSGSLGWTPGKLILFLRVRNHNGRNAGVSQGILREIVKYVGTSFMFLGGLWALYGIVTSERTFYDDWIGLDVEDLKPSGLTETQKNWRAFQKSNRAS
jgi:uncharacterized RDD family membrane protein YckC